MYSGTKEGKRGVSTQQIMMKSSVHAEEDDFVPELQRSIHPRERPDWEETLSAMARGADIPDIPGELPLRSCGSTASMKVKNVKKYIPPGLMGCDAFHRLSFTKGHFPKMAECAHFHYENVDFGNIQLATGSSEKFFPGTRSHLWKFQVPCFFFPGEMGRNPVWVLSWKDTLKRGAVTDLQGRKEMEAGVPVWTYC
uniref:Rho GTPase-activating protein 32 n=1 Tax=Taeniopygia guttata TaxID=59729 RepID=A0A674H548_TAEGU